MLIDTKAPIKKRPWRIQKKIDKRQGYLRARYEPSMGEIVRMLVDLYPMHTTIAMGLHKPSWHRPVIEYRQPMFRPC